MNNIYQDIAERTNGDIYIGVVGPVRTGKSTFIKRFMDSLVIPNIDDPYKANRAMDELPQSSSGRTIMTTEPKFIPNEAISINLGDNAHMKVRLIDCVGYVVDGANGHMEDEGPRMVRTPWSENDIPFTDAAEIGTKKVIYEHSNIGLVITTDSSFTDIDRKAYREAEDRVINELKSINKPFIVLVNSKSPMSVQAKQTAEEIEIKHGVRAVCVNCLELDASDITKIIEEVLFEFPVVNVHVSLPGWFMSLDNSHYLKTGLYKDLKNQVDKLDKIRDIGGFASAVSDCEYVKNAYVDGIDLGCGNAKVDVQLPENMFYNILGEASGFEIKDEENLIKLIKELSRVKAEYDKVEQALISVRQTGYGIVSPGTDELTLEEPKIVRHGSKYGVKLCASAPSIHIMCNKPKSLEAA